MKEKADDFEILPRGRCNDMNFLRQRGMAVRLETVRLNGIAGLGHYSSVFSCAEIFAVLYYHTLRLRRGDPKWPQRDRFLLGKGHAAVGLWSIYADLDFFAKEWLEKFGDIDQPLTDHPDMTVAPGVDFSSGSLGHNLSVGVGMAIAARKREADHRVFVVTGDGELHEGQIWEAAMAGPHLKLGNLVLIVDANGSCAGGKTSETMNIEPLAERFAAFGWRTVEIDGHDVAQLAAAFDALPDSHSDTPTCVIARTKKGRGVSFMEKRPRNWHLGFLGPSDKVAAIAEIERGLI